MLRAVLVPTLLLVFASAARAGDVAPPAEKAPEFKSLTVAEVRARIEAQSKKGEKVYIFDNNPRERFDRSHLPGAVWLKHDDVKASDLPVDKSAALVFYCANER